MRQAPRNPLRIIETSLKSVPFRSVPLSYCFRKTATVLTGVGMSKQQQAPQLRAGRLEGKEGVSFASRMT